MARQRSYRAAATELDMFTSALSQAVAALEARIGVRLFNRTTRSVSLSEAGEQFAAQVSPAMDSIHTAMEQAANRGGTPTGTLRINTSAGAARQLMTPMVLEYLRRYPEMHVDLVTESRMVDIVASGFDADIRLAESVPQDMVAVPFGATQRFAVVGSPTYFAQHKGLPRPRTPADLRQHRCIRSHMPSGAMFRWEFARRGESIAVDVAGPITLDEPGLMLEAARARLGLAYLSEWNVAEDLAAGRLLRLLEDWTPPFVALCLYYTGRRHQPAGLRALVALIHEQKAATTPALPARRPGTSATKTRTMLRTR